MRSLGEREFFIDDQVVQIYVNPVMIQQTVLIPWGFGCPIINLHFQESRKSTSAEAAGRCRGSVADENPSTSLITTSF